MTTIKGETSKAHDRRVREGWFQRYCRGRGIDIGCGGDIIAPESVEHTVVGYDRPKDATFMVEEPDLSYAWVYASHILEDFDDPHTPLVNWWRLVDHGGYLIVVVPHKWLYEKKNTPPSRYNLGHRSFWLPVSSDGVEGTRGLLETVSTLPDADFISLIVQSDGHTITDPLQHSDGEYSIEIVLRKR